jgi:O-antigen ligase
MDVRSDLPLINPAQTQSESGIAHVLNLVLAVGICVLLIFGPLAFGATEPSAIFLLEVGIAALLAIWAVRSLAEGRLEIARSSVFVPMLLLAAVVAVQLAVQLSPYWYATWQKALLWGAYGILAFVAVQCFRSAAWLRHFGIVLTVFGFALAMFAILQRFAGNGKIYWVMKNQAAADFFGPYPNHAHFAGLMEMLIPFPLVFALARYSSAPMRLLYSFAALIMGSSVFLSKSRGGVIALVIELGVLTLLAARGRPRRHQLALISGFGLLLIFCVLLVRPHGLWDRFLQVGVPADKLHDDNRLSMLEDSLRMARARPVLGWGFGNFATAYPSYRSFYTDLMVNAAHDDVVQLTVETGVVGLALVIAFLYLLFRDGLRGARGWRHDPRASIALAALVGCTGLVLHSFSDFNLQVPANAALFFVLAAMATASPTRVETSNLPIQQIRTEAWQQRVAP